VELDLFLVQQEYAMYNLKKKEYAMYKLKELVVLVDHSVICDPY